MYTTLPEFSEPRVSITASKKIAPSAVVRNRLRRRGYDALRPLLPRLSAQSAILVSYLIRDTQTPIKDLTEDLRSVFLKTGLYK